MFYDDEDLDGKIKRVRWGMERLIERVCGESSSLTPYSEKDWSPAVDIYETEEHLVILAELAGLTKEDIKITVDDDNVLRIHGRRPDLPPDAKTYLHQMEISFGDFERSIQLSKSLKGEDITASYHDGFLQIMVAKTRKPSYTRQIEVFSEDE